MTFAYGYGYDLSYLRKVVDSGPVIPTMLLTLSRPGNQLWPEDVQDEPDWFSQADFVFRLSGRDINFLWVTDHWEVEDNFATVSGRGTVSQGSKNAKARYVNAELPFNPITAASSVHIVAAGNVYITWSGD